jgi:hypothetical protein
VLEHGYAGRGHDEGARGGDIEAALFPDIKGFGVQLHPEMMSENRRGAEYYKEFVYNIMYNGYDSVL